MIFWRVVLSPLVVALAVAYLVLCLCWIAFDAIRKPKNWLIACAVMLAGCAPREYTGPALFLGDSITLNWDVAAVLPGAVNKAIDGAEVPLIAEMAEGYIREVKPGMVHILAGTNDKLLEEKLKTVFMVLKIGFAAKKAGAQVVVIGTVPPVDWEQPHINSFFSISRYNTLLMVLAPLCGFVVADYNSAMADHGGYQRKELFRDAVHPNTAGYVVMGGVLVETLK